MNPVQMQQPSMPDIPLHDIKPLVEVPDNSLTVFIVIVVVAVLLAAALIYLLVNYLRRIKKVNERKISYEALQNIDFSDAKKAAYAITRYGSSFADDGERYRETYENLVNRLSPYKYKKLVDAIDDETIGYYRIYVEMIDV